MLRKDDIKNAVDELDANLLDSVHEARYKKHLKIKKSKTLRLRAMIIGAVAMLTVAAMLIPLGLMMSRKPDPADLPVINSPTSGKGNTSTDLPDNSTDNPTNDPTVGPTIDPTVGPTVDPTIDPITPSMPSESSTSPWSFIPPQIEVPEWYIPGELTAKTLTREAKKKAKEEAAIKENSSAVMSVLQQAGQQSLNTKIEDETGSILMFGARYINTSTLFDDSEHKGHLGVLYDLNNGQIICASCLLEEKLPKDLLSDGERIALDGMTDPQLISFAILKDDEIRARYLYEPESDLLREVPVLATLDFDFFNISPDGKYLKTMAMDDDGNWKAYLIDAQTFEIREVSFGESTFHHCFFSPDGQSFLIVLQDENGSSFMDSDKVRHLMVNAQTGAHCTVEGKILSYANDLLVTRKKSIYHVYDRINCTEIDIPENTFAWEKRQGNILRINVQKGTEEIICQTIDGWQVSDNGLYAFGYKTGEKYLTCWSLTENDSFEVYLNQEFVTAVTKLQDQYDIFYSFSLNDEMTEILICYSTSRKIPVVSTRQMRLTKAMKQALEETDNIIDFVRMVEELAPNDKAEYTVYLGDGYTHLLFEKEYVIVEDYRNGTFRAYSDQNYKHDSSSPVFVDEDEEVELVKALGATKEETDAFISSRRWTGNKSNVDYQTFYIDGAFSLKLTEQYKFTEECLNSIESFTVYNAGSIGYNCRKVDQLCALLRAVRNESQNQHISNKAKYMIYASVDYGHGMMYAIAYEDGTYTIYGYVVPKKLFDDFVSFAYATYIDNYSRRIWESNPIGENTPVLSAYLDAIAGKGENLTVDQLKELLEQGLTTENLSKFNCEVVSKSGYTEELLGSACLLFPVYQDDTLKGYLYLHFSSVSKDTTAPEFSIDQILLFDGSLHYISNLLREELPEGDWTVQDGITLPEYTVVYRKTE